MMMDPADEIREILAHYDLGELVDFERNDRGYVNTSFSIITRSGGQKQRRFLRKYKKGIREQEIQFEHSLINHLVKQNTLPVACVYPTQYGETYLHRFETSADERGIYYAIFDYLPGDDKYTWVDARCTPVEIRGAAVVLACYHSAVSGFTPRGKRDEPRILDLFPVAAENVTSGIRHSKGTPFDDLLKQSEAKILRAIRQLQDVLNGPAAQVLPEVVIHCDYHPGNLKFENEEVCGLFDFDWSKLDWRCFDLGLAAWYFFASWQGSQDGELQMESFQKFLEVYQHSLADLPGIGPLTALERQYLPAMIQAGNIYVLNWTLEDYFNKDVDPAEYLVYLQHSIRFTDWYENSLNQMRLVQAVASH